MVVVLVELGLTGIRCQLPVLLLLARRLILVQSTRLQDGLFGTLNKRLAVAHRLDS